MSDNSIEIGDMIIGTLIMDSGLWDSNETRTGIVIDFERPSGSLSEAGSGIYVVLWSNGTTANMRKWMIKKAIK